MSKKPADAFRILHTADWHLGKMLNEQSREEEQKRFLDWLLKQVVELEVDVVLVAGDIFDTANPPQSAEALYYDFVAALHGSTSASLVLIGGNHDSANQLEAPKRVLKALRTHVHGAVADDAADRLLLLPSVDAPKVAIAMVPFLREKDLRMGKSGDKEAAVRKEIIAGITRVYEETAKAVKSAKIACPVIATGHLTVAGSSSSESERDIHIGGLGAVDSSVFPEDFAYVALGHLHRPQSTDKAGRVRYSGSPIALSFSEVDDKKEVRLLDVTGKGITQSSVPVPVFRKLVQLKTSLATLDKDLAAQAKVKAGELPTWVEVVLSGHTGLNDANSQVQTLAHGQPFEVLKVMLADVPRLIGAGVGQEVDTQLEGLLDKPTEVFDLLLKQQKDLPESDKKSLRLAFSKIVDRI
ncbi:MAG: exonuclease SbcCD subunit D C-terminal domain-containing protein [Opitutales bacterium]|nr:exonuclease SbcCD subunit D C-terminal domain-containing protein [Opitutales bacterium]